MARTEQPTQPPPAAPAKAKKKAPLDEGLVVEEGFHEVPSNLRQERDRVASAKAAPEIRNRILRLVLAGKVIHIDCTWKDGLARDLHHVCQRTKDGTDKGTGKFAHQLPSLDESFDRTHTNRRNRNLGPNGAFDLKVLQACRQIHQEASVLPYTDNTFVFGGAYPMRAMVQFLKQRVREQAHAIRTVYVVHAYNSATWSLNKSDAKGVRANLQGLQNLTYFVELYDEEDARTFVDIPAVARDRTTRTS